MPFIRCSRKPICETRTCTTSWPDSREAHLPVTSTSTSSRRTVLRCVASVSEQVVSSGDSSSTRWETVWIPRLDGLTGHRARPNAMTKFVTVRCWADCNLISAIGVFSSFNLGGFESKSFQNWILLIKFSFAFTRFGVSVWLQNLKFRLSPSPSPRLGIERERENSLGKLPQLGVFRIVI